MFNKKYIIYLVLAGLCFIVYANSLNNGFVSDDVQAILENPSISRPSNYLLEPQPLLNSLSYRIAKFNVLPYHLFSIVIHSLNTLLIFFFLSLFFKRGASVLGAAIFAVHPIHTEAVTWISGRTHLISAFFTLATYLLYVKATRPVIVGKNIKRAAYLFSLAIFSYFINKNYSFYVFFPFLIILSDVVVGRWRKSWKLWLPFILITALTLIIAANSIQERISLASLETGKESSWSNLFFYFVYSIFSHLWLLIWPARLSLYHDPVLFYPWAMWSGFAALCIVIFFLPYLFKRAKSILLGLGIFVLFLAPTYSPFPVANVVAERYAYLPCVLLSILVAFFYQNYAPGVLAGKKRYFVTLFIFIIAAYGVRTLIRNKDWKDAKTLWMATLKVSPLSAGAHNNAGFIYMKEGNIDKAIEEFNLAIKINPARPDSYSNLGVAYKTLDKPEEAIALYKKAIALKPDYAQAYNNLANIYQNMGKHDEAIALYKKAISLNPDYTEALNNLGVVYKNLGRIDEAVALYQKALTINPDYAASYKNLSVVYYLKDQRDLAIKYYYRAVELGYKADPYFLKLLKSSRKE